MERRNGALWSELNGRRYRRIHVKIYREQETKNLLSVNSAIVNVLSSALTQPRTLSYPIGTGVASIRMRMEKENAIFSFARLFSYYYKC